MNLTFDWISAPSPDRLNSLAELRKLLDSKREPLLDVPVLDLARALDEFGQSLLSRQSPLHRKHPGSGLPFIGRQCMADILLPQLADNLGDPQALDCFFDSPYTSGRQVRAWPKGVVVHWLAGNVPTLGLLSLLPAMLTKNANLIRIPSKTGSLLGDLMSHLHSLGPIHALLAEAVAVVRYDYSDAPTANAVSLLADVRIIWGGDESAKAIKSLPTQTTCTDIVFPDRTSFAIVGRQAMSPERLEATTRLLAHDISVFEQKACASPHTVFLATEDAQEISIFCKALDHALGAALKSIPKQIPAPREAMAIMNLRSQYDMLHEAWYPTGLEYSVLSDDTVALGPPIGNRTIFVRPLPTDQELVSIIPPNIQSVGLAAEGEEFERLTAILGRAGVHRFPPLGAMTNFELPWDGCSLPSHLVRWTVRPAQ